MAPTGVGVVVRDTQMRVGRVGLRSNRPATVPHDGAIRKASGLTLTHIVTTPVDPMMISGVGTFLGYVVSYVNQGGLLRGLVR